jgi:hypothetical protein
MQDEKIHFRFMDLWFHALANADLILQKHAFRAWMLNLMEKFLLFLTNIFTNLAVFMVS